MLIGHSLDQLKVLQIIMRICCGGPKIGGDRPSRMMVFSINQRRKNGFVRGKLIGKCSFGCRVVTLFMNSSNEKRMWPRELRFTFLV